MDQFINQKFSPKGKKISQQQQNQLKKPLKIRNYIFGKSKSLKFDNQRHSQFSYFKSINNQEQIDINQPIFIPKLKNKQLLCQPKFFFSLERKKSKLQNCSPNFQQIKIRNTQIMKGSKLKSQFVKSFFNKRSNSLCLKQKPFTQSNQSNKNKNTSKKSNSCATQSLSQKQISQLNTAIVKKRQFLQSSNMKKNKRPNINQNISFLIRRKKQIKNRISLNKINQSKSYMSQFVRKNTNEQNAQPSQFNQQQIQY